jgi:hypothetical protein
MKFALLAVPDTLRHCEQWHCPTPSIGPSISKRTAPQRQLPRNGRDA